MKIRLAMLAVTAALLAGCGNDDASTSSIERTDTAPQIDADPTPQTGTGGPSETTAPAGTVNGAPGQPRPAE